MKQNQYQSSWVETVEKMDKQSLLNVLKNSTKYNSQFIDLVIDKLKTKYNVDEQGMLDVIYKANPVYDEEQSIPYKSPAWIKYLIMGALLFVVVFIGLMLFAVAMANGEEDGIGKLNLGKIWHYILGAIFLLIMAWEWLKSRLK